MMKKQDIHYVLQLEKALKSADHLANWLEAYAKHNGIDLSSDENLAIAYRMYREVRKPQC